MNQVRITMNRPEFGLRADLQLPARGITMLFGPSGSGKTTLRPCVALLKLAQEALIHIRGHTRQDYAHGILLAACHRPLRYVFR